ncbi:hypothetical protein [Novosphingobium sp. FKTRR1]|uniref:hypothetical protein n=1 Tax=Novosphingobium sp. FKTRR1 TaxID=2879118 RepID=UPI001CF01841|nr:hypothetical protein [Novosphingobium sp. FKTRR1]
MPADPLAAVRLSGQQCLILSVAGIVVWFAAALLLGTLNAHGLLGGTASVIGYALTVPGTLPFVLALERLARLAPAQIVPGYTLATVVAMFCDGSAVAFWPTLYGTDDLQVRLAAGAVLWGAAVGIALAFGVASMRARRG